MDANNYDDVFSSTTNWRVAGGGLTDSISFESSFSPSAAKHESEDRIIPSAVDHVAKSPLLLLPPFPNGDPCEITITFAQEHELRQVYIRSTARVYEVYCTQKRRNDREYLCTVRCGVAAREEEEEEEEEEEVLQIPLTESSSSKTRVEPVKDPMERRVKDNGNGRTNEDDWVEVKAGDDSLLSNEKYLLQMPQLGKQDFFEATAEINDAEPCISITLRLLSLQDKGCALVDEIYVFADPIDQSELEEEEASGTASSSSSSLMAMFMPTLLQLSRGKDVRKERDRQVSDKSYSTNPGTLGNSNDSGKVVNEIQQEINSCKTDHKGVSSPVIVDTLARHVDATRVSGAEIKPDTSCNNVETTLDQLVNKVSRIETILTRFEDQMLRPINSIDARLQLVEKKLEQLGKKSFESELFVETEIPNPDSLGSDTDKTPETIELDGLSKNTDNPQLASSSRTVVPDSSSIDNSEDYAVVLPKNGLDNVFTKFLEQGSENNSISGNEVISAESKISSEEVGHSFGRGATEKNPKHSLSINNALASALAGLLSSTSVMDGKHSQALVVTAPEFSNEDDMEMEKKPLTGTHPDESQVTAEEFGSRHSVSDSPISSRKEPKMTLFTEDNSQEMINGVSEKLGDSLGGYDEAETVISVRKDDLDKETVTSSTKADCYTEREYLSYEPGNPDCLVHELENPNVTTGCRSCRFINEGEPRMDDVLKSILSFQPTTWSVDFQIPVLDVKFNSEKKVSENKCFFEALLTAESKTVVDCNKEAFDDNLVSVEDEELKGPPTDTLSSVEMVHYESNEMMPLQLNADISTASLI